MDKPFFTEIVFVSGKDSWWCKHVGHIWTGWSDSPYGNADFEVTFRECLHCDGREWRKRSTDEIRQEFDDLVPKPPVEILRNLQIPGHKYPPPLTEADPMLLTKHDRELYMHDLKKRRGIK